LHPVLHPGLLAAAVAFALGAIVGSFLGVVYIRLPRGEAFVGGRSRCDQCGSVLAVRDLVPLLSYLVGGGRCRYCGSAIAVELPVLEIAAGLVGVAAWLGAGEPAHWLWAVFGWLLLLLAALDLRHFWLPTAIVAALAATGLVTVMLAGGDVTGAAIGGVGGFIALEAIRLGYRRLRRRDGMGAGDPRLLGAIGIWLGWQALPFVLVGGALIGLVAVAVRALAGGHVDAATRVPLGTCLALAAIATWLIAPWFRFLNLAAL
jgi:leader peptidase (prepilin peptidase)/N-methyltransferase